MIGSLPHSFMHFANDLYLFLLGANESFELQFIEAQLTQNIGIRNPDFFTDTIHFYTIGYHDNGRYIVDQLAKQGVINQEERNALHQLAKNRKNVQNVMKMLLALKNTLNIHNIMIDFLKAYVEFKLKFFDQSYPVFLDQYAHNFPLIPQKKTYYFTAISISSDSSGHSIAWWTECNIEVDPFYQKYWETINSYIFDSNFGLFRLTPECSTPGPNNNIRIFYTAVFEYIKKNYPDFFHTKKKSQVPVNIHFLTIPLA